MQKIFRASGVKKLRKDRGLTQKDLALRLGISRQTIFSVESGKSIPSLILALKIAKFFEESIEEIFFPKKGGEKIMFRDLIPWEPFRGLRGLHDEIDRLFEEATSFRFPSARGVITPAVNVRETGKEVIVEAAVPGYKEEDLEVEVSEDSLTLKGRKEKKEEVKEVDYYRREFACGAFVRQIPLPSLVKSERAEAKLTDGTLVVTIPKTEVTKPKVKKIKVTKK